jgi:hypothetical protein
MRKEVYGFICLALSYIGTPRVLSKSVQFKPHPVRGLKLSYDWCMYNLHTTIEFKRGINIALRHNFRINALY